MVATNVVRIFYPQKEKGEYLPVKTKKRVADKKMRLAFCFLQVAKFKMRLAFLRKQAAFEKSIVQIVVYRKR